jgi:hypothetical protein
MRRAVPIAALPVTHPGTQRRCREALVRRDGARCVGSRRSPFANPESRLLCYHPRFAQPRPAAMIELNPVRTRIADLASRLHVLRGYL